MKRWMFVLAALVLPTFAQAQVNALPAAPSLLVKGHAEGRYMPDRFIIRLDINAVDMNPGKARNRVERHMQKILAALDTCGVMPGRTHATSFSIKPETDFRNDRDVFVGTKVDRTIKATFDSVDKLRRFVAMVPASKEVQIMDTEVERSDIDKVRDILRERAIANSKAAAKHIAAAYGMKVKGLYSVSEVAPSLDYGMKAGMYGSSGLRAVTVSANALNDPAVRVGTIKVEQDIYAVFLTQP